MTGLSVTGMPVIWNWQYKNTTKTEVSLWLAIPPSLPSQSEISVVDSFPRGFGQEAVRQAGPNRLAFVTLPPGEQARLKLRAVLATNQTAWPENHEPGSQSPLTDTSAYLDSTALITVSDEVGAEARAAAGETTSQPEIARRLYLHLLKTCRYIWPPAERGSEHMRLTRRGDCGEYAFLYAALCRSLGIPCRVLVGTLLGRRLLGRRMLPHAWNEIYLAEDGWVRVDVNIPEIILGRLAYRGHGTAARWATRSIERRFGLFRPDRLAFSVDPGVVLDPPFQERKVSEQERDLTMDGRPFAWGFETLEGGVAPYLQPCYIRFGGDEIPRTTTARLGHWHLSRQ